MTEPVALRRRHPVGYRWVVMCVATGSRREWVIDGAPDRAAAEALLARWEGRSTGEWNGEYTFHLVEAIE